MCSSHANFTLNATSLRLLCDSIWLTLRRLLPPSWTYSSCVYTAETLPRKSPRRHRPPLGSLGDDAKRKTAVTHSERVKYASAPVKNHSKAALALCCIGTFALAAASLLSTVESSKAQGIFLWLIRKRMGGWVVSTLTTRKPSFLIYFSYLLL